MFYEFECKQCNIKFTAQQPIMAEHKSLCPKCGIEAERKYHGLRISWGDAAFRPDGSYRGLHDYDILKG